MGFWIQASKPKYSGRVDIDDESLQEAIETLFPLMTENLYIVWNNIHIPLSYKYDVSVMCNDIVEMLNTMLITVEGRIKINWPSNTFRSTWVIDYTEDVLTINAEWESVIGELEENLNRSGGITIPKSQFISEWRMVMLVLLDGLKRFYNMPSFLDDINKLEMLVAQMNKSGCLYEE